MNRTIIRATFIVLAALTSNMAPAKAVGPTDVPQQSRVTTSFDPGWRFIKADATGAEKPGFDDASWRALDVPHDWSIEGPFAQTNPTGAAGAFLPAGVGWYRKHFVLAPSDASRRVFINFDGVMANSDVWINGEHLGHRPFGYVSFRYELTGHLRFGDGNPNLLAVRVDDSAQPASRWYAGAGINRHVWLSIMDPVHLEPDATFITTPKVTENAATVRVQTMVINQSDKPCEATVLVFVSGDIDSKGDNSGSQTAKSAPQTIEPGKSASFEQDVSVEKPALWDLEHPMLHPVTVQVVSGDKTLDAETISIGIRQFEFKPDTGFWLNGKNLKLKGVCLHGDAGALGTAVPLRAWERRLELLRGLGVNAIRTAHNPPDPRFLALCDRMGFLVMDEMFDCWTVGKNPYDYHLYFNEWSQVDARDTIRRDRNHPCIVLYSAGNEIHDTPQRELAKHILGGLVEVFHENDPTRPVTQALFRPNVSHDYDDGLADLLDVVGQNYRENEILAAYRQKPTRKIVGTENRHDRQMWLALRDNAPYAGQFLWTGIDYLGESPGWPSYADNHGLLDRTGTPRPLAFERQSWWSDRPMVSIARRVAPDEKMPTDPGYAPERHPQVLYPDWTPANTRNPLETVEVYSNCEQVELILKGKSLGAQPLAADASPRVWKVNYEPGTLRAVASNKGQPAASCELRTAGQPAKIRLTADRSNLTTSWDDISYVAAEVTDKDDVLVPGAGNHITFAISGAGVIAAVDSGDNANKEPFQASQRHAFQGRCFALVKARGSAGPIQITASAPGLISGLLTLNAVAQP